MVSRQPGWGRGDKRLDCFRQEPAPGCRRRSDDVPAGERQPVRQSYEADYNAIKGLQALAGEFNIAIVIVHHTRKSGSDVDPFEKVSGTLGLSGAADAALILDRDGNGATLYGRGRDVEELEVAVSFDKTTCRWSILGAASEVRRTDERSLILTALRDSEEPMTSGEIADATLMPNQNVRQLLAKMVKDGEVRKVKRGLYQHPDHNQSPRSQRSQDHKPWTTTEGERTGETMNRAALSITTPDHKITRSQRGNAVGGHGAVCDLVIVVIGGRAFTITLLGLADRRGPRRAAHPFAAGLEPVLRGLPGSPPRIPRTDRDLHRRQCRRRGSRR